MTTTPGDSANAPVRTWTVLSLLEWADGYLKERSFGESRLNAELLLAHALGLPRLGLYLQFDRPLDPGELARFKSLILRRTAHEPVQYITGETDFMGLRLEVTPAALIPRPETEELVEEALRWLKDARRGEGAILEIGTGTGNIAIALGKFLPGAHVLSIEKSAEALALARRNLSRHALTNVELMEGDLFGGEFAGGEFDAVVSNPPYVPAREFTLLEPEVRDFEPSMATTDGADGLEFLRRIAPLARARLRPGGGMFVEIGYGQEQDARAIAAGAGLTDVDVKKDFAGIARILKGIAPGGEALP